MLGSPVLEVAIGIVFVFVIVSIICTAVREGIEAWMKTRAAFLHYGVRELLHDKRGVGLAPHVFKHPLIHGLFSGAYVAPKTDGRPGAWTSGADLPSYIPSRNFALALMDIAARGPDTAGAASTGGAGALSLASVRTNISNLGNPEVQRVLLTAIDAAEGDLDKAVKGVEAWYDSAMDRVSGWYRRSTQWVLFWIALFVTVALNINTISIVHYLSQNEDARAAIVEEARKAIDAENEARSKRAAGGEKAAASKGKDNAAEKSDYQKAREKLDELRLPIGWSQGWGAPAKAEEPCGVWNCGLGPLLGWLITAVAATLGAPFWFDVLNKFMVIRSTVKPHEKSPEEASEDRQHAAERRARTPSAELAGAGAYAVAPGVPLWAMQAAQVQNAPDPVDHDAQTDACDVDLAAGPTPDTDLPQARGGVART